MRTRSERLRGRADRLRSRAGDADVAALLAEHEEARAMMEYRLRGPTGVTGVTGELNVLRLRVEQLETAIARVLQAAASPRLDELRRLMPTPLFTAARGFVEDLHARHAQPFLTGPVNG